MLSMNTTEQMQHRWVLLRGAVGEKGAQSTCFWAPGVLKQVQRGTQNGDDFRRCSTIKNPPVLASNSEPLSSTPKSPRLENRWLTQQPLHQQECCCVDGSFPTESA